MKDPARVKSSLTTNVLAVCVGIALNVLGIGAYISYDRAKQERSSCLFNQNAFSKVSASFLGCHAQQYELCWNKPEKFKAQLLSISEYQFPTCPSGGTYTIHFGKPQRDTPYVTCSCPDHQPDKP